MSHIDASIKPGLLPAGARRAVPTVLAATVVLLQVAYPLVPGGPSRDALTVVTVLVFGAASLTHALVARGPRFTAALVLATTVGGFSVEIVGVTTGVPFGEYRYLGSLGTEWLGVPLVVALAWTMMAYPAYVVAEVIGGSVTRRVAVGGWALASWDLFLDPQMVQAGHWEWTGEAAAIGGIPISNYVAWFVVASAMMLALRVLAGPQDGDAPRSVDDRAPLALYAWTWASSALAHAVFFGLPESALLGGVGMGVVVLTAVLAMRGEASDRHLESVRS